MNRRLQTVAAALTTLALVLVPTVAMAQSAGDTQYSDPLAGGTSKTTKTTKATTTTKTAPSVTKTPPVKLPTSTTKTTATTPATTTTPSSTTKTPTSLPRTGLDEWMLVAMAAALLLAGFGLRMRTAGVRRS